MNLKKTSGLFLFIILLSSCNLIYNTPKEEQLLECNSNCYYISLRGSVIDKVTNKGINTIPVTLNWKKPECLFCSDNMINKIVSDNSGNFIFANSVDTSFFSNGYQLNVSIPVNNEYIIFPWENYFVIHSITDSNINNLRYELYPRTQLTIQIEKQQTDSYFDTFIVEHYFRQDFRYMDRLITRVNNQYDYPVNDTYKVETSADIKTYIRWTKIVNSVKTIGLDSIVCAKGKENVYKIKY